MKVIKSLDRPIECNECGKPNHYLLEIGEPTNYESWTAQLCFDCINKALNVVKRQIPKNKRRLPNEEPLAETNRQQAEILSRERVKKQHYLCSCDSPGSVVCMKHGWVNS